MVSNISRPLYITLTFAPITTATTMVDNNAFGFNKCNFGIRSDFKNNNNNNNNNNNFSNSVKWNIGNLNFNSDLEGGKSILH